MAVGKVVTVDVQELRDAFDFVSAGAAFDAGAYICLETGKIFCRSPDIGLEAEDLPDDIEDETLYLALPSQNDLNLGRRLALAFAAEELPHDYDTVVGFFRRRGAYGRFKDLLHARGKLTAWYAFESQATDEALRSWCADNDIEVASGGPLPDLSPCPGR